MSVTVLSTAGHAVAARMALLPSQLGNLTRLFPMALADAATVASVKARILVLNPSYPPAGLATCDRVAAELAKLVGSGEGNIGFEQKVQLDANNFNAIVTDLETLEP
jgi:hypothetical protein